MIHYRLWIKDHRVKLLHLDEDQEVTWTGVCSDQLEEVGLLLCLGSADRSDEEIKALCKPSSGSFSSSSGGDESSGCGCRASPRTKHLVAAGFPLTAFISTNPHGSDGSMKFTSRSLTDVFLAMKLWIQRKLR